MEWLIHAAVKVAIKDDSNEGEGYPELSAEVTDTGESGDSGEGKEKLPVLPRIPGALRGQEATLEGSGVRRGRAGLPSPTPVAQEDLKADKHPGLRDT